MTVKTPVISENIHNEFARRQLNVRIYRFTPNLDRAVPRLADADQVMALKFEGIIKSSRPWLHVTGIQVSNSAFHRRLKYISNSKVINSSYLSLPKG